MRIPNIADNWVFFTVIFFVILFSPIAFGIYFFPEWDPPEDIALAIAALWIPISVVLTSTLNMVALRLYQKQQRRERQKKLPKDWPFLDHRQKRYWSPP